MKYVQPYGVSDPEAGYVNGNPSTGTMGSIPPAASIEHPQREIHNFIVKCGLTPSEADLFQLAKAAQSGILNYGLDNGTVNQIAITPLLPVTSYKLGMRFIIKVKYGNTTDVTVNVNGVGAAPLIHVDQTPINPWELLANQLIEVAYDGANWQAIAGVASGAVALKAPQHLYINTATGSDTLYDGTTAAISGNSGPFKTIDKALTTMTKYNLSGFNFYIHVADGNYTKTTPVDMPTPNGSGRVIIQGNISNPLAVVIWNTGTGSTVRFNAGGLWTVEGFSIRSTAASAGDGGNGIWVIDPASVQLGRMNYAGVARHHILVGPGGKAHCTGNVSITGNALGHITGHLGGSAIAGSDSPQDPNLTISNPVNIDTFAGASANGNCRPVYLSITGKANVTGKKYHAFGNGVINSPGKPIDFLPGTIDGTTLTGGQWVGEANP